MHVSSGMQAPGHAGSHPPWTAAELEDRVSGVCRDLLEQLPSL